MTEISVSKFGKKPSHSTVTRFGPKLANLTHFGAKSGNRAVRDQTYRVATNTQSTAVTRDVRFRPNVGQIRDKWDKYGNFSDHISLHFGSTTLNILAFDLKESRICAICSTSDQLWA